MIHSSRRPRRAGPSMNISTRERRASLIGEGLARYYIWDAKRFPRLPRPAGPKWTHRDLGAAGCSGGGALTTFIGALDQRLKAIIPACFPNSYRLVFSGSNPHSRNDSSPAPLSLGLDTADFVELSAPTPLLIQATEQDYFTPPEGAKLVYEEARRWYRLYDAEDKIRVFRFGPGGPRAPLVSPREAILSVAYSLAQGRPR